MSVRTNLGKQHYSESALDALVLDRVRRSLIPVWGGALSLPEQAAAGRLIAVRYRERLVYGEPLED